MTPQTKQRILRAAREEFLRHGYGQAGLRRIAAAAHVTTGAVYNHFGSKHGLFDAIVRGPADLLLADGSQVRHVSFAPELVVRASTSGWPG